MECKHKRTGPQPYQGEIGEMLVLGWPIPAERFGPIRVLQADGGSEFGRESAAVARCWAFSFLYPRLDTNHSYSISHTLKCLVCTSAVQSPNTACPSSLETRDKGPLPYK